MAQQKEIVDRVEALLAQMTLEEKLGQMMQLAAIDDKSHEYIEKYHLGSYLHALGDEITELKALNTHSRLQIPLLFAIDAIHGHCFEDGGTIFPVQLAMACSWNPELLVDVGRVTANEASASGIHWTFSPVLCMGRDPRWGRTSETFGEDPLLVSLFAEYLTHGYQSASVPMAACAKHFVAYGETDGGRDAVDAHVSERQLRSVFLPPFKRQADIGCLTFMVGYQALNGVPCSANTWLLNNVLREEWGYNGVVVTDWNNVGQMVSMQGAADKLKTAVALCLAASNDIFMSTPEFFDCALALVREGRVSQQRIDESVRRILSLKFTLGLFDTEAAVAQPAGSAPTRDALLAETSRWDLAEQVAQESLVLLKNDGVLPFSSAVKKILLVGDNADDLLAHVGDWSFIPGLTAFEDTRTHRNTVVTLKDALAEYCEQHKLSLEFIPGCGPLQSVEVCLDIVDKNYDVIIFCVGDTLPQHGEFHDRADLSLTGNQLTVLAQLKALSAPLVSVLLMSKPLIVTPVAEQSDALLLSFNPGAKGGLALTKTLFGRCNAVGKLPISFPRHEGQLPVYYNQATGWHSVLSPHYKKDEAYIDVPASPLFAFGEGLSYSQLETSKAALTSRIVTSQTSLTISLKVINKSDLDAITILQLYVKQVIPGVTSPKQRLVKFRRVPVAANTFSDIEVELGYEDLTVLDIGLQPVVPSGDVLLMIGDSSNDPKMQLFTIRVKGIDE